jgi:acyl-coenzyme A synthetase/AMP-(fatty) acid ligase
VHRRRQLGDPYNYSSRASANGATTLMFEGVHSAVDEPVWGVIDKVNTFYTAPTAIGHLMGAGEGQ